jgi:hypothetical protein
MRQTNWQPLCFPRLVCQYLRAMDSIVAPGLCFSGGGEAYCWSTVVTTELESR